MTAALTTAPAAPPNAVHGNCFGSAAAGIVTSGLGAVGVWVGLLAMFGTVRPLHIGWLVPLSGVYLAPDPLGGFFVALTGGVAIPVGLYAIGYARREHLGRVPLAVLPVFVAAMLLVPAAGSVTTFLVAWELMALASLILVLAEHTRPEVRSAGLMYAVMTQLGFVAILIGLMVLSAAGGADRFAALGRVPDGARIAVFALTAAGFGSKAGLVPLHAWLPRAHPEAPSPVSALMSAAMVNLGIYGIIRFDLQLLGPGPRWWGLVLLVIGGMSALYGVLQATVATDLKRLLAYSTTENMGLITLALGAATLFADAGAHAFLSEWLLIQSLIHAASTHNTLVALTAPLAVGAVALTTGLGVAAMVKAFGIGFLARPRSAGAADAREAPGTMRAGMTIAAAACVVLAVAPMVMAPVLRRVLAGLPAANLVGFSDFGAVLRLPGLSGSISPGLIAAGLAAAVALAVVLARWRSRRRPKPVALPLWACGADDLTARMQYTATSFAEPLQRVFDDVLRPDTDIEVTHLAESRYMAQTVTYRAEIADAIEARAYPPVIAAVTAAAGLVRRAHTGSVHLYLAYGALGVLIVLVVAR